MPVLLGLIFDHTCLLWQENCTGQRGACWIYDINRLGVGFSLVGVVVKSFSCFCFTMGSCLYKPPDQPSTLWKAGDNTQLSYINAYESTATDSTCISADSYRGYSNTTESEVPANETETTYI